MKATLAVCFVALFALVGCKEERKPSVSIPTAAEDSPPAIRISNAPAVGFASQDEAVLNGLVGQTTASGKMNVTLSQISPVFISVKAENQLGGVQSLSVVITKQSANPSLQFTGKAENVALADGTVPTTLAVWGTQTALGPQVFLVIVDSPVVVEAIAKNFTGGTSTLTEILSPPVSGTGWIVPNGRYNSGNGSSSSSSSCSGSPPSATCTMTSPEGCEVTGKYACVSGSYKCKATANVDYCTMCGNANGLNCGTCGSTVCSINSECSPGSICAIDASAGPGVKTCQRQNLDCPVVKCWLPKNLSYDRTKCFTP